MQLGRRNLSVFCQDGIADDDVAATHAQMHKKHRAITHSVSFLDVLIARLRHFLSKRTGVR